MLLKVRALNIFCWLDLHSTEILDGCTRSPTLLYLFSNLSLLKIQNELGFRMLLEIFGEHLISCCSRA